MAKWNEKMDKEAVIFFLNNNGKLSKDNIKICYSKIKDLNKEITEGSVKMKLKNIQFLYAGIGLAHFSNQMFDVYLETIKERKPDEYQEIKQECEIKKKYKGKNVFCFSKLKGDKFYNYPLKKDILNRDEDFPLSSYFLETFMLVGKKISKENINILNRYSIFLYNIWDSKIDISLRTCKKIVKETSQLLMNSINLDGDHGSIDNGKFKIFIDKFNKYVNEKGYGNEGEIGDGGIQGCVAIADSKSHTHKHLFALSGSDNDYIGSNISGWSLSEEKKFDYHFVSTLLTSFTGFNYIPCHLNDNGYRYTEYNFVLNSIPGQIYDGKLLENPVNLIDDFASNGSNSNFTRHYSCCEKKIVSFLMGCNSDYLDLQLGIAPINVLNDFSIKISRLPCVMCRPALVGFNTISFGYATIKELATSTINNKIMVFDPSNVHRPYRF